MNKVKTYKTFRTFALTALCGVALSACASSNHSSSDRVNSMLERAANQAQSSGNQVENLGALEQLYKRNSADPKIAMRYARALRQEGFYKRASLVLSPFANDPAIENNDVLIEYATITSAMGNYIEAENAARSAVIKDPSNGEAYHILGIALDAQGHHEQAKNAFEKAIDNWSGNPSRVLNNTGLNLAALGFLDEALDALRKAKTTASNKEEIERNIRIVSALQYQPPARNMPKAPSVPSPKPDRSAPTAIQALNIKDDVVIQSEPQAKAPVTAEPLKDIKDVTEPPTAQYN